jgi:glycosyltransferase involved in cell wall biosynthesis
MRPRACSTQPTVTVVIPCYRYGRYLPDVVSTTLAQKEVQVDVIIVDDASPDDSAAIARSLADRHDNVSLIAHSKNRGHIATYNEGLAAAAGKYVVLLSADDLLAPGSLARSTALMECNPCVSFVYGYSPDFVESPPRPMHRYYTWTIWQSDQWLKRVCLAARNVVGTPEVVMRRDVMNDLGGYESRLPHTADLLIWLRAATKGSVGRVNGPDQAYYRVHGQNMHLTDFAEVSTDLRERCKTFDTFINTDLANHPRQQYMRRLVHRALAVESLRWAIRSHDDAEDNWQHTMQTYGDIAVSLWPEITTTSLWVRFRRRTAADHVGTLDRILFNTDWELRHRLRWRRWRRFGT